MLHRPNSKNELRKPSRNRTRPHRTLHVVRALNRKGSLSSDPLPVKFDFGMKSSPATTIREFSADRVDGEPRCSRIGTEGVFDFLFGQSGGTGPSLSVDHDDLVSFALPGLGDAACRVGALEGLRRINLTDGDVISVRIPQRKLHSSGAGIRMRLFFQPVDERAKRRGQCAVPPMTQLRHRSALKKI